MTKSKYDSKKLENFLIDSFGTLKLGEIEKGLIINATNMSTGSVHVFKSVYQEIRRDGDYTRDGNVPLYKAVLASRAAPGYFDPVEISGDTICDGAFWANNPALVGYVDAIRNFKESPPNIKIFSIGTGRGKNLYNRSTTWGVLTGWERLKLIEFAMLNQTQHIENCMRQILSENMFRVNPEIRDWKLDNCAVIPTLKSIASMEFSSNGEEIKKFFT